MGNDWIQIEGENGNVPTGTFAAGNLDGADFTVALTNGVLTVVDRGDVSRLDDNSLMCVAPNLYRLMYNNFTGIITVSAGTIHNLSFVNNVLVTS